MARRVVKVERLSFEIPKDSEYEQYVRKTLSGQRNQLSDQFIQVIQIFAGAISVGYVLTSQSIQDIAREQANPINLVTVNRVLRVLKENRLIIYVGIGKGFIAWGKDDSQFPLVIQDPLDSAIITANNADIDVMIARLVHLLQTQGKKVSSLQIEAVFAD